MSRTRLTNAADLGRLRDQGRAAEKRYRGRVLVCMTGCRSLGAIELGKAFRDGTAAAGLGDEIAVVDVGCHGQCGLAPVVVIEPQNYLYGGVKPEDVDEIIELTLRQGRPVERLCQTSDGRPVPSVDEAAFYRNQRRDVLANCGRVDPTRIEDAIARDGYASLAKVLTTMQPDEVVAEVRASGLRGRGGAGFPTGVKWDLCRKAPGDAKYLICNADEGDPGAFMDRALLEGVPHQVIEGMIIAAYAIGASHGFVYVRAEYPIAVEHVSIALEQARECGLLGENIFGTGFSFDIEPRMGAGAFVCGEESALIASLEGHRGMPRPRPPFPVQKGYQGKPTAINNVETLANVPLILSRGREVYAATGTERSKGTKIFALAGKVRNTGLVEVPIGTPLGDIIFDIGGGIRNDRKFKAAQTGGPSGGCIPRELLNTPVDYESFKELGAIMGSGGLIVLDEDTCMVDLARFFLDFVQQESCGKCPPCRIGTRHMLDILRRICGGAGEEGDIERLEELAEEIKASSLCGLGQTAPNPVLSTIRYFRDEYEAHISQKRCPAVVCKALFRAPCEHGCPAGVNVPIYVGKIGEGKFSEALAVIRATMPFAGVCGRVCHHPCEAKCMRGQLDEPLGVHALKRFAADYAAATTDEPRPTPPPPNGYRVAVVGGGPAGLSAAWELARRGYLVKVYEALPVLGGMLAVGIPEYRLPAAILQREIDHILALGVQAETSVRIGKDLSLEQLQKAGHSAIFLALGAWKSTALGIPGEELPGVVHATELLREVNLSLMGHGRKPKLAASVAVVGGGNAAIDAARTALRLGAKEVHLVYRRTRDEMLADPQEIDEAAVEGVQMHLLATPKRVLGEKRVTGLECSQMELREFDRSGRRRPVERQGAGFVLEVGTVIVAIGQSVAPDLSASPVQLDGRGQILADPETLETSVPGVWAGGDAVRGAGTVIEAIADGLRAARMIDQKVRGVPAEAVVLQDERGVLLEQGDAVEKARVVMPLLPVSERLNCFAEVELGYDPEAAREEANRCLKCHLGAR
ncbi:MAG: NADH-ubiquinone oxidoreductase-F iron-sulfur binding region domain-containing protein [Armatimonadota bacterium]